MGGGGLALEGALMLGNCTISGNTSAAQGGGILVGDEVPLMRASSTVAYNVAAGSGGGIDVGLAGAELADTILAHNVSLAGVGNDCRGDDLLTNGHNLILDATDCYFTGESAEVGIVGLDPLLGPLQDNGGVLPPDPQPPAFGLNGESAPWPPDLRFPIALTHALLPGSPAIDAGDEFCPPTDQRGFDRPQGVGCDIGAYEVEGQPYTRYYVDANNIAPEPSGLSWSDAFRDLQDALSAASMGDEIWVAQGVYKPTAGVDRDISFVLQNGVRLYGGFNGAEISRAQRNWTENVTILSGTSAHATTTTTPTTC